MAKNTAKKAKTKAKPSAKAKPAKLKVVKTKPAKVLKSKVKPAKAAPAKAAAAPKPVAPSKADKVPVLNLKTAPRTAAAAIPMPTLSAPTRRADGWMGPLPDKPLPRATKLPSEAEPLNKRDMEQTLSVGTRGLAGEGSLKGKLVVYQGFPYLEVIGRDKRELWFLLAGPDQEVFPAYADHKVSVSGLIRRHHTYGGTVEVRKYSAKKPGAEVVETAPESDEPKLRLLSPGEVETIFQPGMGVGMRGYATLRGVLEMSGEDFFLVVSHPGTRQQVTFTIEGKASKGLKKSVGQIVVATGIVEKTSAWGGRVEAEQCELRAPDYPPVMRASLDIVKVDASTSTAAKSVEVKLNHGLTVHLAEKQGYIWAIEPQTAKRMSLREVHVKYSTPAVREFFFTPRNPGPQEVNFYLGKALNPMQVAKQFKVNVNVKATEVTP